MPRKTAKKTAKKTAAKKTARRRADATGAPRTPDREGPAPGGVAPLALVKAALDRASKHVEAHAKKHDVSLAIPEGTHPFDGALEIRGDLVQAPASEVAERESVELSTPELVYALLAELTEDNAELAVREACKRLKAWRRKKVEAETLKEQAERTARVVDREARRAGLVKVTPAGTRKGALTGRPSVVARISGGVGPAPVTVEVEGA